MSIKSTKKSLSEQTLEEKFRLAFGSYYHSHTNVLGFINNRQGCLCDHLVIAQSAQDLIKAATLAYENLLPFEIIGKTGLTLLSNVGYPGLLIINRSRMICFDPASSVVLVESGVLIDDLINQAASRSLGSLEVFSGITSTIGGALVTNLTVGQTSFCDYIREFTVLKWDSKKTVIVKYRPQDFTFHHYWTSLLELEEPFVILTVKIQMANLPQEIVLRRIAENHTLRDKRKLNLIAYPFYPPLNDEILKVLNPRVLINRDFQIDSANPNFIIIRVKPIDQIQLKCFLDEIKTNLSLNGIIVKERMKTIGSWIKNEEYSTADT